MFDWGATLQFLPDLLRAAVRTLELTVLSLVLSTAVAVPLAILRQSSKLLVAGPVAFYSWFLRTTPLLVVLFFCYYGLPSLGIRLGAYETAILGFTLSSSAYKLEVVRAGLIAVPRGQFEAARALGLPPLLVWWRIVLPQAMPIILPPYTSSATATLKGTSLASLITVDELAGVGNSIISLTYRAFEILLPVAAIYLALNSLLTAAQAWGERHWAVK